MDFDEARHRRSIRLAGYDYSQPGGYFITIVAQGRACLFGEIVNHEMRCSPAGVIAGECWRAIPSHFPNVELGTFVVMPNHVHGIFLFHDDSRRGVVPTPLGDETSPLQMPPSGQVVPTPLGDETSPLQMPPSRQVVPMSQGDETSPLRRPTLGQVVAYYKYQSSKQINALSGCPGTRVWQRNYYEHIIRDEREHNLIHLYIESNIDNWSKDEENPFCRGE